MKKIFISVVVVAMVIALALGACAQPAPGPAPAPTPAPAEEFVIGNIEALTGMFTGFGEGNAFGAKAAVDDINALGGLDVGGKKMKVRLVQLDNESDPTKSGQLAEDLVTREKAKFLFMGAGPITMWAGPAGVCEKYKVPNLISDTPMEPWAGMRTSATPPWEYNWLTGFAIATPPDKGDFRDKPGYTVRDTWFAYLDMFADKTNKVAAVFASDEADGAGWYSIFPGLLTEYGCRVVGMEKKLGLVPLETTDFSSIIREWKDNNVEILWGNCPGPFFGAMWKQARGMGFKPKIVSIGRAPLFYVDAVSWGADLAAGIGVEVWWSAEWQQAPGIGNTTPKSLTERWVKEKKQPLNPAIGQAYQGAQIALEAIRKAGSLDGDKVNAAMATLDFSTIVSRCKFNKDHYSRTPIVFGQWFKTDGPEKVEIKVVLSKHDFVPVDGEPLFPMP